MKLSESYRKHVFCLECDWDKDLRNKSSILAALDFMQTNCFVKYIHRACGTKNNLFYYLNQWSLKKYKDYSICYLAFHGQPGYLQVGKEEVTLEEIAERLEGKCNDKIIHLGSCLVLDVDPDRIKEFITKTKALCVCGFQTEIDFLESSVLDMLVIDLLQEYKDVKKVERELKKNYGKILKRLNFKIFY